MAALGFLLGLREPLRAGFFRILQQAFATDDGKRILAETLRGLLGKEDLMASVAPYMTERPYSELGRVVSASRRPPPVFITARFRTGSTLLWNLFRHVPGCTAFYEPLNERRWFDPSTRGARLDDTHRGVTNYWREYENLPHLAQWYTERWTTHHLYMDRDFWDPNLVEYIGALVGAAPGRSVLQFNRVDFRLPWLRHHFPSAVLIHLYRHPREQWCSTLGDIACFPTSGTVAEFEPYDRFYLLGWARDLSYHFPFLDVRIARHPYELFYLIWRLSWLFGKRYCDASFCYERLCTEPEEEVPRLMHACGVGSFDIDSLRRLVTNPRSRWREYAHSKWFEEREARCEALLHDMIPLDFSVDRNGVEKAS